MLSPNRIHCLGQVEAMLTAQAVALNAVFVNLAHRAHLSQTLEQEQHYLKLAFKAQSQCRMTLESIAVLKNPPVFARQANIARQQVVNNGTITPPTRTREIQDAPKELLEGDGERLDGREACQTGEGDPRRGTVGAINRPRTAEGKARASQNAYRGGHRQAQRQFARLLARLA